MKYIIYYLFILMLLSGCCFPSIHNAAKNNDVSKVKELLNGGVDPNTNWWGETPLHYTNNTEIAKLLINKGADINATDNYGRTPLHMTKNAEVAQLLLERGAIFDKSIASNMLHFNQPPEKIIFLIQKGADVNDRDINGRTPLFNIHNIEQARLLIQNGANVNIKDNHGSTPLHIAPDYIIGLLINNGAHVNEKNNYGETPIDWAAGNSYNLNKVKLLVKYGADINIQNNKGETPLKVAMNAKNENIVLFLKECGAKE